MQIYRDLTSSWWRLALGIVLLLLPLVLALVWGPYLDDSAYVTFRYARDLARGHGVVARQIPGQTLLRAPLYALVLGLLSGLGFSLVETGWVLSALGWGAAALALYGVCQAVHRPIAAVMVAGFVVFSPLVIATLGTSLPWMVTLAALAFTATLKQQWRLQTLALSLMLGFYFDVGVLILAVFFVVARARAHPKPSRFPMRPAIGLVLLVLCWLLLSAQHIVAPFSVPSVNLVSWWRVFQDLVGESEFYWVGLSFVCLGLWRAPKNVRWGVVLGSLCLFLGADLLPRVLLGALGILFAGFGMAWCVEWWLAHSVTRLNCTLRLVGGVLVVGMLPGLAQTSSLAYRYAFRPEVLYTLEARASAWLNRNSQPSATVLASERVGYLVDRVTWPWCGAVEHQSELADLVGVWTLSSPDYIVSFRCITWENVTRLGWFQDLYVPMRTFSSPYDARSPFIVWGARTRDLEFGERVPVSVRLPCDVRLVGYTYAPKRIQPGEAVYATLFMRTTRPITSSFRSVVEVISPYDGSGWAHQDQITPRSVPVNWWGAGQVLAERFVLTTTDEISTGAYHLDLFMVTYDSRNIVPMQREDEAMSQLDRLTLGYIAVPWQGTVAETVERVGAKVGDTIRLLGFEPVGALSPGSTLDLSLYWEATGAPSENYVVFVHLLNAAGDLVVGHDGQPFGGRYPTQAWLSGDIVPDVHSLSLGAEVPLGTYRLQVGMYRWPSLERLPIWDSQGVEQPDRVIILQQVEVR